MYIPKAFEVVNVAEVRSMIRQIQFGSLITLLPPESSSTSSSTATETSETETESPGPSGYSLDATHVPFVVAKDSCSTQEENADTSSVRLLCHVAKANPIWKRIRAGQQCMVVFVGEQGYISPSWYPSKQETGKVVPTWDYEVVHVHGRVEAFHDTDRLRQLVDELTRTNESRLVASQLPPWNITDAPPRYVELMLQAIVGLEIRVERVEAKRKLSQNRSVQDRNGTVRGLRAEQHHALANAVETCAKQVPATTTN